ncbi:MAG: type III secretion system export apparatus subunit SctR [Methylocystaceae bacterium]|nr:type III secretion system export apparatus subunit SctR [Methylocystaceae bacterium]
MFQYPDPILLAGALATLGLLPFMVVMLTAYTKLVIVLLILRNALGLQQIPPNIVMHGIALAMTMFASYPLAMEIYHIVQSRMDSIESITHLILVFDDIEVPLKRHLSSNSNPSDVAIFRELADQIWPPELRLNNDNSYAILIPGFITSELVKAFEIGFVIYLPFIVIDLAVSNILISIGAMMISPITVTLPIKLFLFVYADGWVRLLNSLVSGYQ